MRRSPVLTGIVLSTLFAAAVARADMPHSYDQLYRYGIVSGFGIRSGDPKRMINRIPAIDQPTYVPVDKASLRDDDLCVGIERDGVMHFAPLFILNRHEVVNHPDAPAIAYCPLAGLSVAIEGKTYISGLLRWDTFVLYQPDKKDLVLPFDQAYLDRDEHIPLHPIQMLSFAGVRARFPEARVLSPQVHSGSRGAYGSYPTDDRLGIGHPKPGVRGHYDKGHEPFPPKEHVMIVGTATQMQKAYPFAALEVATQGGRVPITDEIDGVSVVVAYEPRYRYAHVVTDAQGDDGPGSLQSRAYSYYFALEEHLPDLPVFQATPTTAPEASQK